jgi:hypothetical protein
VNRLALIEARSQAADAFVGLSTTVRHVRDTRPRDAAEVIKPRIRRLADTLEVEMRNDRFLAHERLDVARVDCGVPPRDPVLVGHCRLRQARGSARLNAVQVASATFHSGSDEVR